MRHMSSDEPESLVSGLDGTSTAREALETAFAVWWSEHDPRAKRLLDHLARLAAGPVVPPSGNARVGPARPGGTRPPAGPLGAVSPAHDALSALLSLLDRHGLARPALRRLLIAPQDIEDAEQATLAAVALGLASFDGRSAFTTWMFAVAQNEARMLLRARSRRPSTPVADPTPAPFLARLSSVLADRDLLERTMAGLPDSQADPLRLREIEGLEYEEIARTLDIPVGTVRSRLSRGRATLAAEVTRALGSGTGTRR